MIEKRYKVPNGKLVVGKKVGDHIKIGGDFFLHPEESLEDIENVINTSAPTDLKEKLDRLIEEKKITLVGFTAEVLCNLVKEVRK